MRMRPSLCAVFLSFFSISLQADNPKALPADDTPSNAKIAAPAFVESVTFKIQAEGDNRILTVTSGPTLVRIDAPNDRMSVIYDPQTEHYIGLEHSNYTYWDFTWPQVRAVVQSSQRYAARLRDIGPEALSGDQPATPAPADATTSPVSTTAGDDDSGYVWHPTTDHKRIDDLDCVHWVGETVAGENIDAWCATGLVAPVQSAVATLRAVNEPMALVPVRNFVPPLVFVAWDAMKKAGVTPVLITWGSGGDLSRFALAAQKTSPGRVSLFQVPHLYNKTTLVTMDGIGNQQPVTADRSQDRRSHKGEDTEGSRADGGLQ
jgi:hypothetical protein